jgi:phage gp29-like protein
MSPLNSLILPKAEIQKIHNAIGATQSGESATSQMGTFFVTERLSTSREYLYIFTRYFVRDLANFLLICSCIHLPVV